MPTETPQSIGARAQIIMSQEATWGELNPSASWKMLRVLAGETLDENRSIYASRQIRSDRMSNRDVRGTMRPGGSIPFELSPRGWSPFFWHLFGGAVTTTGSGAPYTHVLKGAIDLTSGTGGAPLSMTIEKGFTDMAAGQKAYYAFYGCRVLRMSLDFDIDQIPTGAFDISAREIELLEESLNEGAAPALPTDDPFTSVQVDVYEGDSYDLLGIAERITLSIDNGYYEDRGFVLGDDKRVNLKPGTRMVTASGRFIFNNSALYEKAIAGTATKLRISASDGTHSFTFDMPNFQFQPNNSTPKITDDGPLSIELGGKATKDATLGTDIQLTIVSPEATINT